VRPAIRQLDLGRLESLLDGFERVRLLVVGDLVLDEYLWGDVDRVSPEAPVPVVRVREDTLVLGGAANVARNAVAMGAQVALGSALGDDASGRQVGDLLKDLGVDTRALVAVPGRPTTRKTRIIARSQQVVRFDRETVEPLPPACERQLLEALEAALPSADAVIVEDYGKGVLSRRLATATLKLAIEVGVPVVVDPKVAVAPYRGAALLKPNLREAESLSGVVIRDDESLDRAARKLQRKIGGGSLVVRW
jgi:D-beta-D-heptose 7-phosphate kinase/D-beta-D-heptose 1-phosphate adenosyltransferase